MKYKIIVMQNIVGDWYWLLCHKNDKILAHSESYSSKGKAKQTAKNIQKSFRLGICDLYVH